MTGPVPRASKTERESEDVNLCHHGRKLCLSCEVEERDKAAADLAEARRLLSEALAATATYGHGEDGTLIKPGCECWWCAAHAFLSQQVVQAIPKTEEGE